MSQLNTVSFDGQIVSPSKIVCVGRNYLDHIAELGNEIPSEPVIFMKPNSAIGDNLLSHSKEDIHYEGELCFIIKNKLIAGVGFGLDLTKRTLQASLKAKGLPWERAKAFDNSAVFSAFVNVPYNVSNLSILLAINGQLRQQGAYALMINKPSELLAYISAFMTLIDNDIVMTGTPSGVGNIVKGQIFTGEVFDKNKCIVSKQWSVL
jgi:2-keto-4-pentenoate hydratase/2-oxohepta-3-ene-1,7-dioic acid hydratase in catechol pathway